MNEDYITSLCIQWSLNFTSRDIIDYICEKEDLPLNFRNKINKEYVSTLNNVNERTTFPFVYEMNHIYVISKIIFKNKDVKNFIEVLRCYAEENELDFNNFIEIIENLYYSSMELANKYWK